MKGHARNGYFHIEISHYCHVKICMSLASYILNR